MLRDVSLLAESGGGKDMPPQPPASVLPAASRDDAAKHGVVLPRGSGVRLVWGMEVGGGEWDTDYPAP